MDDISRGVGAALEAVKEIPSWLERMLTTLDKHHLLPMTDWRKKNIRDKAQIEQELEEQRRSHQRLMDEADADARARIALMEGTPQLALDAAKKEIAEGVPCEQAFRHCLPFAVRATSNLYRETLQGEYSKERIGLYALQAAAEAPDTKCAEGEVSETWNAQFWDYAKNIREEEAMRQWGRLLAAEIKAPGVIPIKALDTLRSLTPELARKFYALQKYALSGTIPIKDITLKDVAFLGLNVYDIALLESNALILTEKTLDPKDGIEFKNEFYKIKVCNKHKINCIILTDVGSALSYISNNSEEDALAAVTYFSDYLKKHHSITPEIEKISH